MNLVEIDTLDLDGKALDWAVAKAMGYRVEKLPVTGAESYFDEKGRWVSTVADWNPSGNWEQCGPLIEWHNVSITFNAHVPNSLYAWGARAFISMGVQGDLYTGNDPKFVACLAIVSAELGDVVKVPSELTQ